MKFEEVQSSNIKAVAFEKDKLYVTFLNGKSYSYDATEDDYKQLMESASKGKHFNTNIKGRPFEVVDLTKLEEDALPPAKGIVPQTIDKNNTTSN
jgi:hypothetical protein